MDIYYTAERINIYINEALLSSPALILWKYTHKIPQEYANILCANSIHTFMILCSPCFQQMPFLFFLSSILWEFEFGATENHTYPAESNSVLVLLVRTCCDHLMNCMGLAPFPLNTKVWKYNWSVWWANQFWVALPPLRTVFTRTPEYLTFFNQSTPGHPPCISGAKNHPIYNCSSHICNKNTLRPSIDCQVNGHKWRTHD